MKKVLIATTNNDKYRIVSNLLKDSIFPVDRYQIFQLTKDMNVPDEKESGDNINRARNKALSAYNVLKDNYDYIVGLDDAIRIKNRLEPNIKEYINKILFENYLAPGELYAFNRAYCIIDKDMNIYEINVDIPYKYHPLENPIELKEHSYPLSKVSYPIDGNKPVSEFDEKEEIAFYSKYVKDSLLNMKDII